MISLLIGTIEETATNHVVLDVSGIGYKVYMTADAIHGMKSGAKAKLYTYLAVREDALDLYGFPRRSDREFFELLISVSGIGPKSALNILSLASAETLSGAIRTGSTAHLTKISGIGKKTAEKIVLELRDKLGATLGYESDESRAGMESDIDASQALRALGYDADEARDALKKVGPDVTDVGAKVKAALKVLS